MVCFVRSEKRVKRWLGDWNLVSTGTNSTENIEEDNESIENKVSITQKCAKEPKQCMECPKDETEIKELIKKACHFEFGNNKCV